jgi:hypothetical protein
LPWVTTILHKAISPITGHELDHDPSARALRPTEV